MSKNSLATPTHSLSKYVFWYIVAMFSIFPLFLLRDYTNITYSKWIAFLGLSLAFLAVFGFSFGGLLLDGFRPKRTFNHTDLFLLLFLLSSVLSCIFSPYHGLKNNVGRSVFFWGSGRYEGLILLFLYILIYFAISRFFEPSDMLIPVAATTGIVYSIIGILQYFGIDFLRLYPKNAFLGTLGDFCSTIGNRSLLSAVLCIYLCLISFYFIQTKLPRWQSVLHLVSFDLMFFLMLAIRSSSGMVGLSAAFGLGLPFACTRKETVQKVLIVLIHMVATGGFFFVTKQNFRLAVPLFLGSVLFAILLPFVQKSSCSFKQTPLYIIILELLLVVSFLIYATVLYQPPPIDTVDKNLVWEIWNIAHGRVTDVTGNYRVGVWRYAWKMAWKRPILGTGVGTFLQSFGEFAGANFQQYGRKSFDYAHNEYLHLFCTTGLAGLFSYLGFLISLAIRSLKKHRQNPLVLVFGIAVFAYCVQAFFNLSIVISAPFFWICLGVLQKITMDKECCGV